MEGFWPFPYWLNGFWVKPSNPGIGTPITQLTNARIAASIRTKNSIHLSIRIPRKYNGVRKQI